MTTHIDLFDLFTVGQQEATRRGGAFVELLNPRGDGVVYLPIDLGESVDETFSQLSTGELQ